MKEKLVFPSLSDPSIGLVFFASSTELWDRAYHTPGVVSLHFGYYRTFGDGLTQHSGFSVVTQEQSADYCASFAAWLIEHPEDSEALYCFDPELNPISEDAIQFLAKVTPEKRYYSLELRRMSDDEKKRNDRRWYQTHDFSDTKYGTPGGVLRLFHRTKPEHWICHSLEYFLTLQKIHDVMKVSTYGHEDKRFEDHQYLSALNLLQDAVAAVRKLAFAKNRLNSHQSNYISKPAAETAA
jgi:hypothetical protein